MLYSPKAKKKKKCSILAFDLYNILTYIQHLEKVPRVRKERDEDFDVPMGFYDGAEVCEIVGPYILNLFSNILDKDLVVTTL